MTLSPAVIGARPGGKAALPPRRRYTETSDYLSACKRMLRAAGRRVGRADPEDLTKLVELRAILDDSIVAAVAGLRRDGFTWETIGRSTGTTRQAAIQKWAAAVALQSTIGSGQPDGHPLSDVI